MKHPLVLLDRDGVINQDIKPNGVTDMAQFSFIDKSLDAIAMLTQAGFKLAIITNQSAIGKGLLTVGALDDIHQHMLNEIKQHGGHIDKIYFCADHPDHPTNRRKPGDGMLQEALADFNVDPKNTPFIGDAKRDLQAALSAGCPRYLVRTGKGEEVLRSGIAESLNPVTIADNLFEAALDIIAKYSRSIGDE